MTPQAKLDALFREIRACTVCAPFLPLGPRPIVRGRAGARILLNSQAPGTRVHETGISFNDRSGDVLRTWMGIDRDTFYDEDKIAIVGTGFCYPGRDKAGGDKPPRPECAPLWQPRLLPLFPKVELTILAGSYAIDYRLGKRRKATLGATIAAWRDYLPELMILPHPSWRNVLWMRKNPWFEIEVLPELRRRVAALTS
jgi:uracil-DNA glycosylase